MTQNLINYANYVENVRHNKQTEAIGYGNLAELGRHNVQTEMIGFEQVGVQKGNLVELQRHNAVTEQTSARIGEYNYDVGSRQAGASERQAETSEAQSRYNFINGMSQAASAEEQAAASTSNAETRQLEQQVTENRANVQNVTDVLDSITRGFRDVGQGTKSFQSVLD